MNGRCVGIVQQTYIDKFQDSTEVMPILGVLKVGFSLCG